VLKSRASSFLVDKRELSPLHGQGNSRTAGSVATPWRGMSIWRPSGWSLPLKTAFDFKNNPAHFYRSPAAPRATPATSPNTGSAPSRLPVETDSPPNPHAKRRCARGPAIFISHPARPPIRLAALVLCERAGACTRFRWSTCRPRPFARESETVLPTLAGPEIGVASTKAFTCQ